MSVLGVFILDVSAVYVLGVFVLEVSVSGVCLYWVCLYFMCLQCVSVLGAEHPQKPQRLIRDREKGGGGGGWSMEVGEEGDYIPIATLIAAHLKLMQESFWW